MTQPSVVLPAVAPAQGVLCAVLRYLERGLVLTPIRPGSKKPRGSAWNTPPVWIDSPELARRHWRQYRSDGVGLIHGPSGTCALDIDDLLRARAAFAVLGLDLDSILARGCRIIGKPDRAKAIYSVDVAVGKQLARHVYKADGVTVFELRGGNVQDALPPTTHPDTHLPYAYAYAESGLTLPPVPREVLALFLDWSGTLERLQPAPRSSALPASPARPTAVASDTSVIDAFNDATTRDAILSRNGYEQKGERWLAPNSETGVPGVVPLDGDKVYSHHGADPLADGHAHDAFDLFRLLEHGGDLRNAVKAAADQLGLSNRAAPRTRPAPERSAGGDMSTPHATPDARPSITIRPELTAMTDEAVDALVRRPVLAIYVRGRMLVTVARDGSRPERWLRRPPGAPVIVPIETPRMLGLLDEAVQWMKWSERAKSNMPAMPPDRVAAQVLGRLEWPLPYLEAVIETPTLRPDGSVLNSPGWDEATGLLYEPMPGTTWPDVPDHPTRAHVHEAVNALLDPVQDFPFVAPSDRTAYLAAVLSLVARHMIDGPVPLFAIRAPTPGTGKTLLGDVIGLAGTGRVPPAMTMTYETEEMRKRITSLAVAGTAVVLLDNLSGSLGSDALAAALTKREWEDRILGVNRMVRVPLTTVWLATGNNLGFRRTLARRVVPIDMDAKLEQPEDRTNFRHADLLAHVSHTRPQLVTAALRVLRGFHVAGRPAHRGARMGSYEAWDDLIRSAIVWAGLEDPATANDATAGRGRVRAQADDDTESLATLLTALDGAFEGGKAFTSADAMKQAEADEGLRRDLELAAPAKTGKATVSSLGYALRAATDRPCGDLVLRALKGKRPRAYQVLRCA